MLFSMNCYTTKALEKLKAHDPSDPQKRGSRAHTPGEWLEVRVPLLLGYPSVRKVGLWHHPQSPDFGQGCLKTSPAEKGDSWEGKVVKEPRLTPCLHCFLARLMAPRGHCIKET